MMPPQHFVVPTSASTSCVLGAVIPAECSPTGHRSVGSGFMLSAAFRDTTHQINRPLILHEFLWPLLPMGKRNWTSNHHVQIVKQRPESLCIVFSCWTCSYNLLHFASSQKAFSLCHVATNRVHFVYFGPTVETWFEAVKYRQSILNAVDKHNVPLFVFARCFVVCSSDLCLCLPVLDLKCFQIKGISLVPGFDPGSVSTNQYFTSRNFPAINLVFPPVNLICTVVTVRL